MSGRRMHCKIFSFTVSERYENTIFNFQNDEEDTSVATTVGSDNIGTTAGPANNPTTENPKKDVSEGGKGKGKKKQHTGKGGKDKKPKSRQVTKT